MTEKRDYLASVCIEPGLSAQEVQAAYCFRCLQPECVRSLHGRSRFEARTAHWHQALFSQVPQMAENDSRLVTLRSKKFIEVAPGRIPEVGGRRPVWSVWTDPRDLEAVEPRDLDVAPKSPQSTAPRMPAPPVDPDPTPMATPKEALPDDAPPAQPAPRPAATTKPMLLNTQVQQGQMIGGLQPPPPADPWDLKPAKDTAGVKVVKAGARIKMGGSGV